MYTIDSGVPILPSREQRYPFAELAVGESFSFQLHEVKEIRSAAQYIGKKYNKKFSVRKDKADGVGRCWRVS